MKFSKNCGNDGGNSVGSKLFTIIITACITFSLTLIFISTVNNGIVFMSKSEYGDVDDVLMIGEIMQHIDNEFYGTIPDSDTMLAAAAKGIVSTLGDPYAQYFTKEEFEQYRKDVDGSFSGLGILVKKPDSTGATIDSVYDGSPAQEAGLLGGDIITAINGERIGGYDLNSVSELLTGNDGDKVTLTILRGSDTLDITVTFGTVTVKNVDYKTIDNIGYIYVKMFAETTPEEFSAALEALKDTKALIIDLRNNPGGSLTAVVDMADMILNDGIIVSVGRSMEDANLDTYQAEEGGVAKPIVVLTNGHSASASEIFAAALSDNEVATLIGTTTYGKGIVQTSMPLSTSDGWIKFTTDAYFTPNGISIHGLGVAPDIRVELPSEFMDMNVADIPFEDDTQLAAAIDYLLNQLEFNA